MTVTLDPEGKVSNLTTGQEVSDAGPMGDLLQLLRDPTVLAAIAASR